MCPTTDMTDVPTIAVVGAPDVAVSLRELGFRVITGPEFRAAATEISTLLKEGKDFPVIVADRADTTALVPWTQKTSTQTHVVVLGTEPGYGLMDDKPNRLPLPASVNDLLGMLRYQASMNPVGAHQIAVDGSVSDPAAPVTAKEPAPLRPLPLPSSAPAAPRVPVAPVVQPVAAAPAPAAAASTEPAGDPDLQGFPADLFTTGDNVGAPTTPAVQVTAPAPATEVFVADPAPIAAAAPVADIVPAPFVLPTPLPQVQPNPVAVEPVEDDYIVESVEDEDDFIIEPVAPTRSVPDGAHQIDDGDFRTAPATSPAPEDDFFARRAENSSRRHPSPSTPRHSPRRDLGRVILSASGKGGVGKSSSGIAMAEIASREGLRVVVVDANRGQADLRKYLRLGDAPLRTAYDAYVTGDPAQAILTPDDYGHLRRAARLDVPDFAIVLGPPRDQADPRLVSAAVYGSIIDHARSIADLVIVDTQIIEAHRTDLWDDLFLPLLRTDAWMLAITDESTPGVSNLIDRITEMQSAGLTSARVLVLATQYDDLTEEDAAYFQSRFAALGTFIGNTSVDVTFHEQLNLGRFAVDSPGVLPAYLAVLDRVTGRSDLFSPRPAAPAKRGLFNLIRGRK